MAYSRRSPGAFSPPGRGGSCRRRLFQLKKRPHAGCRTPRMCYPQGSTGAAPHLWGRLRRGKRCVVRGPADPPFRSSRGKAMAIVPDRLCGGKTAPLLALPASGTAVRGKWTWRCCRYAADHLESGRRPARAFLFFACPKKRNQKKGHPTTCPPLALRVPCASRPGSGAAELAPFGRSDSPRAFRFRSCDARLRQRDRGHSGVDSEGDSSPRGITITVIPRETRLSWVSKEFSPDNSVASGGGAKPHRSAQGRTP